MGSSSLRDPGGVQPSKAIVKRRRVTTNASSIYDDKAAFRTTSASSEKLPVATGYKENATYEEQVIIRFPVDVAPEIRNSLLNKTLPKEMEIEFFDERHGYVTFKETKYRATLVDLPCIIETHKTLDKKQFYKIADICQMIIVSKESDPPIVDTTWPHGLTKPMTFVRKRRFRQSASKAVMTAEDIEKMVQKLIEADMKAIQVEHELVDAQSLVKLLDATSQTTDQASTSEPFDGDEAAKEYDENEMSDDSDLAAEIEYGLLENEDQENDVDQEDEKKEAEAEPQDSIRKEAMVTSETPPIIAAALNRFSSLQSKIHSKVSQLQQTASLHTKKRFEEAIQQLTQKWEAKQTGGMLLSEISAAQTVAIPPSESPPTNETEGTRDSGEDDPIEDWID